MGTLANSEDSDASVSALFAKTKSIFRQGNIFLESKTNDTSI